MYGKFIEIKGEKNINPIRRGEIPWMHAHGW